MVGASLSVSFAADSGTSQANVSSSSSAIAVYSVPTSAGGTAPSTSVVLRHGSTSADANSTWGTPVAPAWSVAGGSSGSISSSEDGDLAYLDASGSTSTKILVSVFVTNMGDMAENYTSWAFNIAVTGRAAAPTSASIGGAAWATTADQTEVITSDSGTVNFVIDTSTNKHFSLTMDEGGSFYTVQTSNSDGLAPKFFIRATQL